MTTFPTFKTQRLAELIAEPYGDLRIPDLQEVLALCKPNKVLEIGCFRGVSTEFWLLHCAKVTAVDPWPDGAVYRDFTRRCGHYPNVDVIRGFSPLVLGFAADDVYDMVYIDGDHSYEAVKKDITSSMPLLTPHPWIAGHDYHPFVEDEVSGVWKAVHELIGVPEFVFSDGSFAKQVDRRSLLKDWGMST